MAGIKDVAAKAGVSISTVSYVMSGKRSIGEATKQRVLDAAKDLGYTPNIQAQVLRGEPSKVLAISYPVHSYTDYSSYAVFFFNLAARAKRHGYDILLLMHEYGEYGDAELSRVASKGMADGILLLDVCMMDSRAEIARTLDVPVVSVGYPQNSSAVYSVDLDMERMGRQAIERAHALGHSHVLIVGATEPFYEDGSNFLIRFREAALRRAADFGMHVTFRASKGYDAPSVDLTLGEAFGEDPDISLVICQTNGTQVANAMLSLRRRGLDVPGDVSVLAACTNGLGALSGQVDEMPMRPIEVCARAVDVMVEILNGKRSDVGSVELVAPIYLANGSMGAAPGSRHPDRID